MALDERTVDFPSLIASQIAAGDFIALIDISDATDDATGSDKKGTVDAIRQAIARLTTYYAGPIILFGSDTVVASGATDQARWWVPPILNGANLTDVQLMLTTASSSGIVSAMVRNVTDSVNMLTTAQVIGAAAKRSTVAASVDVAHRDLASYDEISFPIVDEGTGAKGLAAILTCTFP